MEENPAPKKEEPAELSMAEQLQRAVLKPVPKKDEAPKPKPVAEMSLAEQLQQAKLKPVPSKKPQSMADQLKEKIEPKKVAGLDTVAEDEAENHESVKPGQELDT